jgi:hypothetical protein
MLHSQSVSRVANAAISHCACATVGADRTRVANAAAIQTVSVVRSKVIANCGMCLIHIR